MISEIQTIDKKNENNNMDLIYTNDLVNEFEEKWNEIEEKKTKKAKNIMTPTKTKKIEVNNKMNNNESIYANLNLKKLIHPYDFSFDNFTSQKLAELELMKPQTHQKKRSEIREKVNENKVDNSKKSGKTFLKEENLSINQENKVVTIDDLIIQQQNEERPKKKIISILDSINDNNNNNIESEAILGNKNSNLLQTIKGKNNIFSTELLNEKNKKSFLIKEEIKPPEITKPKKERAADKIGKYTNENISKISLDSLSQQKTKESNKILKKIVQNSKLISQLFPKAKI